MSPRPTGPTWATDPALARAYLASAISARDVLDRAAEVVAVLPDVDARFDDVLLAPMGYRTRAAFLTNPATTPARVAALVARGIDRVLDRARGLDAAATVVRDLAPALREADAAARAALADRLTAALGLEMCRTPARDAIALRVIGQTALAIASLGGGSAPEALLTAVQPVLREARTVPLTEWAGGAPHPDPQSRAAGALDDLHAALVQLPRTPGTRAWITAWCAAQSPETATWLEAAVVCSLGVSTDAPAQPAGEVPCLAPADPAPRLLAALAWLHRFLARPEATVLEAAYLLPAAGALPRDLVRGLLAHVLDAAPADCPPWAWPLIGDHLPIAALVADDPELVARLLTACPQGAVRTALVLRLGATARAPAGPADGPPGRPARR